MTSGHSHAKSLLFVVALACAASGACRRGAKKATEDPLPSKIAAFVPGPVDVHAATVQLGKLLFFEPRVSGDGTMSCATCHDVTKGFCDGLPKGKGHGGKTLGRNVPSVVNVDARAPFFWDGRAATAEEQALGPMTNPDEMAGDIPTLIETLNGIPEYVARFAAAFGDAAMTKERIAKAIADYERTLLSSDSPFDHYLQGDKTAISPEAERGYKLFISKAQCVKCHDGPHLTDASFHNIGVNDDDPGRFKIVPVAVLKGAFKTSGLRDVDLTAPYFHDGSAHTLMEVVEHYDRGGDKKDNLDADIHPLDLTADEKAALVAFMKSLTGKTVPVESPRLPRVVTEPHSKSTKELMKSVDGMLEQLDKLISGLDAGHWKDVRAAVEKLTGNAEELATLRVQQTKPERLPELKERLGNLILEFRAIDDAADRENRNDAMAAYERARQRCEQCHDAFRWTKKQHK